MFAAVLYASIAQAQPHGLDTRPHADDAQLREALQEIRLAHDVPGLAAAIFDTGDIRAFGVGELAIGGGPVAPESRFLAGQVALVFNGLLAATLVTDGSLPADAELRRLAPEVDLHNPWSDERAVRIDDLLAHRAGVGPTRFRDVYSQTASQPLLAGINRAFRALRLVDRPGDVERYSIVGPSIVAYLSEKAAGMPYEDALQRLLLDPLGMEAAFGHAEPQTFDSAGHSGRPARTIAELSLNLPPAGEVWISARDLAKVGQLLVNKGRFGDRQVVSEAALQWLESTPVETPGLVPGYRRGVAAEEFNGFLFHTQTGALPGFLARFAYSHELGKGYLVLLNHGDADSALAEAEALLRGQIIGGVIAPPVQAAEPAERDLAALSGWYRNTIPELAPRALYQSWLAFGRASLCGGRLCFSRLANVVRLEAFDAGRLRAEGSWYPGWRVHESDNGIQLETRGARWERLPSWEAGLRLLAALFVLSAVGIAAVLLPTWTWLMVKRRINDYHQLVPRLVPLAAIMALVAGQVALFTTDYPALGIVGSQAMTILVLSILAPVLAVVSLPAALAGFFWGVSRRSTAAALYLALAACAASIAMALQGLIGFQTWNY